MPNKIYKIVPKIVLHKMPIGKNIGNVTNHVMLNLMDRIVETVGGMEILGKIRKFF